jgi:hypothetical protein
MARPVEIRASYDNDMSYLTRLSRAVEKDDTQTIEWKRECTHYINTIIVKFAEANNRKQAK